MILYSYALANTRGFSCNLAVLRLPEAVLAHADGLEQVAVVQAKARLNVAEALTRRKGDQT